MAKNSTTEKKACVADHLRESNPCKLITAATKHYICPVSSSARALDALGRGVRMRMRPEQRAQQGWAQTCLTNM